MGLAGLAGLATGREELGGEVETRLSKWEGYELRNKRWMGHLSDVFL